MGTSPHTASHAGPRFRVLGPLEVVGADGAPVEPGGRRARELLGVLLLHPHQQLSTARLVDSLWGADATDGAPITLRTYVGQVRRLLATAGWPDALVNRDGGYVLQIDPAEVDADQFERLVDRGQEELALGDPAAARTLLAEAVALWRGALLADLDTPEYAAAAAGHLEQRRTDAHEALAECELALGRHRDVVPLLQQLVAEHPFRERFTAQLVLALYRSGRQADALQAYATTRERLADELGLDPSPELAALEAAVLRQDPALGVAPPLLPAGDAAGPPPLPDAVLAALARRPLVGRDAATGRLAACWRSAVAGGAAVALVSGPAGIGKSRLAAEAARLAREDGALVLVGRCEAATAPYQPLLDALRDRAPERPTPVTDPEAERDAWERSLTWALASAAAGGPVLLVVEDAERVDPATGRLLRQLARTLPGRTMVLVCYRDPPGSRHPPLRPLLGDPVVVETAERVRLGPLSEKDLAALAGELAGDVIARVDLRALHRRSGGNPFYATELLRAPAPDAPGGTAEVPVTVHDVLRPRLQELPTPTRELLDAAAVLGPEAPLGRLAAVLGRTDDEVVEALEPAVADGLLVPSGGSWAGTVAFAHGLTREAVYGDIAVGRRERLHATAAALLLAATDRADFDVVAAAHHLRRAGAAADRGEAAEVCRQAARTAGRALAWEEAVDLAEAAVSLVHGSGPAEERWGTEVRTEVEAALLRLRAGLDPGRAVVLLEDALRTALAHGDTALAGLVHSRLGGALCVHHAVMDVPRALDHFAAAERMLPDASQVFHLHRGRAQAAMYGLRADLLADASRRARELGEALGRPDLTLFGDWGLAWHAMDHGQVHAAEQHLERAWEAARDRGDAYLAWGPVNAAALFATLFRLDPGAGRAWCRRGTGQPRFGQFRQPHDTVVDQLAHALLMNGELGAAREVVDGLAADASSRRALRFRDGDWEGAAVEWAAALARDRAAGNLRDALVNARWLTEALQTSGEEAQAREVAEEWLAVATTAPHLPGELWFRAELARMIADSDPSAATAHLAACRAVLASGEDWGGVRGHVLAAEAVVALAAGQAEQARTAYEAALDVFATLRLPWHRAAAQHAWARVLVTTGHDEEAAATHDAAVATYERIGAAPRWTGR